MYPLDVNFLKDRPEYQSEAGPAKRSAAPEAGNMLPLFAGVAVGVFLPAVVGLLWLLVYFQGQNLQTRKAELTQDLQELDTQLQAAGNISGQINAINDEVTVLASAFNQVKPWSAMLQTLAERYPVGVRVGLIEQAEQDRRRRRSNQDEEPKESVEIFGIANSFDDVNDFLLLLQRSPFFDPSETLILKAEYIDDPSESEYYKASGSKSLPKEVLEQLPDFIEYRIKVTLTGVPATELVQALERTGTVGLVSRIRKLQSEGVIQQ